jgi:hypothetical protein
MSRRIGCESTHLARERVDGSRDPRQAGRVRIASTSPRESFTSSRDGYPGAIVPPETL